MINNIDEIKSKTRNRLLNNKWYHATTLDGWKSICDLKVKSDYNKDTSNDLDFGFGFYLTDEKSKAEQFITRLAEVDMVDGNETVIIEFEFIPLLLLESGKYSFAVFERPDDYFAEFVFTNRTKNYNGKRQHTYDIIYGVMSDSLPTKLIIDYERRIISKDDVKEGLKKPNSMKQLSLHLQELCDIIIPSKAYLFNAYDKIRKELDINEYGSN